MPVVFSQLVFPTPKEGDVAGHIQDNLTGLAAQVSVVPVSTVDTEFIRRSLVLPSVNPATSCRRPPFTTSFACLTRPKVTREKWSTWETAPKSWKSRKRDTLV